MEETLRVLVVDDEEGMREGMRRVLERNSYQVDLAENGEEAIKLLKANSYDLALIAVSSGEVTDIKRGKGIFSRIAA